MEIEKITNGTLILILLWILAIVQESGSCLGIFLYTDMYMKHGIY